ncbi:MAG: 4-(cytidine 5'-diphospho)-2-C-methyl-D-erythritol kinase [Bacillaceae bacterium]|nr:4-(cytidine 5'-diphospho)-2-C-methyl-D-erythritol kinase [Bacillaceae bacterium]
MRVSIKAPAKINLALDVLTKRDDGFHEVEMIMTTVDLADRIELRSLEKDVITIEVSEGFLPSDQRNLAYQAAQILKDRFQIRKGVAISIQKNIPVSAGLAGGSTDAAATLRGLNQIWKLGLSMDELAEIGSEIGSDVSFCVYGGTALATGRGEVIQHIESPPLCWVVLAKPPIGVSTAEVYRNVVVDELKHPDIKAMLMAIEQKDYTMICENLGNVLEGVTFKLFPEVKKIKEQMMRFGADGVLMSGSGPTVFGLVRHETKMLRVCNGLRGFCSDVYAVRLLGERNY